MQKGISPLIATVLLIAFTIAIGGIAAGFFTQFSREQTESATNKGTETIDCGSTAIEIKEVGVQSSTDLVVNIENLGQTDILDIDLSVKNQSSVQLTVVNENFSLASGRIDSLVVEDWGTQAIDQITATTECPNIISTAENQSGTFVEVF